MKTLKSALVLFFFSVAGPAAFAQNADEIITKYIQAIGGAAKLRAVNGLKMEMAVSAQGMEIPVEMVQLRGGKMYVKINLQGQEITQMASDGNTIWTTNMSMKPEKIDAESTENAKLNNQDFPDPFLDYKAKGYSVTLFGKETKEGIECHKIKLTKKPITFQGEKKENSMFYYFDVNKNWPVATETDMGDGTMSLATMSDYQQVDGIYYPFSMNQGGQDLKVKKITLNPVIDEKAFAFPGE